MNIYHALADDAVKDLVQSIVGHGTLFDYQSVDSLLNHCTGFL